jgi:WD40 repeat protein
MPATSLSADNTVKGVAYFGDRSQFVVSGCDSGHVFIYDARTARVVNMLLADRRGAVNCLSPHPQGLPILLTSGLEHDAKLWEPGEEVTLDAEEARGVAERNESERRAAQEGSYLEADGSTVFLTPGMLLRFLLGRAGLERAAARGSDAEDEEEDDEGAPEGEDDSEEDDGNDGGRPGLEC